MNTLKTRIIDVARINTPNRSLVSIFNNRRRAVDFSKSSQWQLDLSGRKTERLGAYRAAIR